MSGTPPDERRRLPGSPAILVALGLLSAVLLATAAVANSGQLNPDAVVYLRFAQYAIAGRFDLMISGAYSFLLSVILAPLLAAGIDPLGAARIGMALSGALFWAGSVYVAEALETRPPIPILTALVVGLAVVPWSIENITPDLLEDGLLLFAFGTVAARDWPERRSRQVIAGLLFGLAYYAKAIALPLAVLLSGSVAFLRATSRDGDRKMLWRALVTTLGVCGLVVAPWILILSLKYGYPTFGTSGRMAHALVGPPDIDRRSPTLLGFRTPEPGRLCWGEDATVLPWRDWSAFDSRAYAEHQLRLLSNNRKTIFSFYRQADRLQLGFWMSAGLAVLVAAAARVRRWRPGRVVVVPWLVAAIYLPVYAGAPRYFWIAYPFLFLAAASIAAFRSEAASPARRGVAGGALAIVAVSFLLPVRPALILALRGESNPAVTAARRAAARLSALHLGGAVAGSGDIAGGMSGLYLAFFLDQPWVGDRPDPDSEAWFRSGAALVVAPPDGPLGRALKRDPRFRDLTRTVFGRQEGSTPIEIFRIEPPAPERS